MFIQPYLMFDGRCDEAIAFYKKTLGAETTMLMRFGDSPDQGLPPGIAKDKVMHAAIRIGDTVLLASDGNSLGKPQFQGVSLSFTVDSAAQADKVFAALADGGKVTMPIATTFFAKRFGQVTDRFGLSWMILLPA